MTEPLCINFQALDGGGAACLVGCNPESDCCPSCAGYMADPSRQPCEVWSRVMGYHRPVSGWNPGKQQEYRDRVAFREVVCE